MGKTGKGSTGLGNLKLIMSFELKSTVHTSPGHIDHGGGLAEPKQILWHAVSPYPPKPQTCRQACQTWVPPLPAARPTEHKVENITGPRLLLGLVNFLIGTLRGFLSSLANDNPEFLDTVVSIVPDQSRHKFLFLYALLIYICTNGKREIRKLTQVNCNSVLLVASCGYPLSQSIWS